MSTADLRVERDAVHALYRQGPRACLIAVVVAAVVVAAMWKTAPHGVLSAWFGLVLANQAVRIALWSAFHRADTRDLQALRTWAARYTVGMGVGGGLFGCTALFLFPAADALGQAFLMVTISGMAAGSVTTNAYHRPALFVYLPAILLPMAAELVYLAATRGASEYGLLAFAFVFYCTMLLAFGRSQADTIRRSLEYAHRNDDLVEQLRQKTELAEAAQARAEQASLAKSQFFAAASHDLRQPMQALGLYAASLRELRRDPQDAHKIDQILSSVDALESLFDELLDISKLDAGHVKPQLSHFALATLYRRLEAAYAPIARKNGLDFSLAGAEVVVHADPVLLERVLGNLVSNALRYTEQGGVKVMAVAGGETATIEVADTGIGIPPDQHERVFEEFFQLRNPERDRRKGLGLGLATVRRITRLLGYPLHLESDVGMGTVFRLEVPAGDPAQAAVAAATPEAPDLDALRGRSVLVVEDEADVREGLVQLLRDWHCDVVAAASAAEALVAMEHSPEAVLADYRLRDGLSGIAAVADLRAHFGDALPAILLTGDTAPEIFAAAREHHLPLLTKPVRA
ncbi:MAG TPA: hybrid sensor histidine kinase/response regulator, partial [Ramlibacter sp.]|nr:hybrid sensor histidine kinase/response regulator [Ramlibacter sp.]